MNVRQARKVLDRYLDEDGLVMDRRLLRRVHRILMRHQYEELQDAYKLGQYHASMRRAVYRNPFPPGKRHREYHVGYSHGMNGLRLAPRPYHD